MWTVFEVFVEFVTILLLFMSGFFTVRHVGSELPKEGLNPHPLRWKVKSSPLAHWGSPCPKISNVESFGRAPDNTKVTNA